MEQELAQAMRIGMRRLAAGVSVLSTTDSDGRSHAMTVSSVTSLSDTPPSLLVCVNRLSRICSALVPGQAFAINVLGQEHQDISVACSTGDQSDIRFSSGAWQMVEGEPPHLIDAQVVFICIVDQMHSYGTHNIVIGRIQKVQVPEGELNPLVYLDGLYRKLTP